MSNFYCSNCDEDIIVDDIWERLDSMIVCKKCKHIYSIELEEDYEGNVTFWLEEINNDNK